MQYLKKCMTFIRFIQALQREVETCEAILHGHWETLGMKLRKCSPLKN